MKSTFGALALLASLLWLPGVAAAGPTSIAQLPLLNMDGTGTIKPNIMLLYDNSGSMASAYTPDNIADGTTCRSRSSMAKGTVGCSAGHPPFASPDFNRQYYDPKVTYLPPVNDLGDSYPSQTSWTAVKNDAFGVNYTDLIGGSNNGVTSTTNLVTGFPDVLWCDGANGTGNCSLNTATYTYPNDTVYNANTVKGNPYYYNILVAEYCSDKNLTKCTTTPVGATAPANYPYPAKVRWCDSTALTNCQAKYVGAFKYPRFSRPTGGTFAYGTITIGASAGTTPISVNSVTVTESTGAVVITNGATQATNGTTTLANQAALAEALAASIIAKTGLTNKYMACVYNPSGTIVPACSKYGITLPTTNTTVAVIPVSCVAGFTGKTLPQCTMVADSSRDGWKLAVDTPTNNTGVTGAVAKLTVSGTGGKSPNTSSLASLTLGTTKVLTATTNFATNASSSAVATALVVAINAAKVTGVSAATNCNNVGAATVCITTTANYADNQVISTGTLKNGTLSFSTTPTSGGVAPNAVPTALVNLGGGASVFQRVDIVPTNDSYPKDDKRTDCAGTTCTYIEEMTNFANWYTYYKTRNQMMKTSVGLAFNAITKDYNVGVVSLSTAAAEGTMTVPQAFIGQPKTDFYNTLYKMNGSNSTPLRKALNAVGKMYANVKPYYVADKTKQVIQYPCQQNYTFMTTDGYWNGAAATGWTDPSNNAVDGPKDNDNVENAARFCLLSAGCVDGSNKSTAGSLADVSLFWYNGGSNALDANGVTGSLRTDLEGSVGLVMGKPGENTRLHMNTFTLGLGVDGIMDYESNYEKPEEGGDFYNLTNGVQTGCPWNNNGPYVWPNPAADTATDGISVQTRVDDLWHAAVNGHGKYFSAATPTQVIGGLRSALSNIFAHAGAAAAAATSTPNLSSGDNDQFSVTFTTVDWSGEMTDKKIDPASGVVGDKVEWSTSDKLATKVAATSDTRRILMLDVDARTVAFKNFTYANLNSTEQGWFKNMCGTYAQCAALSSSDRAIVNNGATIVNWLRGQQQYADGTILRAYGRAKSPVTGNTQTVVLGDLASSKPFYVRAPNKSYSTAGYAQFVKDNATRKATVYVGANDGMLHAFNTADGDELWAYVPRITMPKLYKQADTTYGSNHQYTVDGSPEVGDVQIGGIWRSVLVSGLAAGGRGYFALDVTDPANPAPLWETCADATVCKGINNEPEMGLTFGNPQTGLWKDKTGASKWVVFVTSGYNNISGTDGVSGGGGKGWLMVLDIATGQVLEKTATTGRGDTTTPSGLARMTAISANPVYDPAITYVYAGDVLGQMWRFDTTVNGAPVVAELGDAGATQPITARPDVTYCTYTKTTNNVVTSYNQVMVGFGTGRLLSSDDLLNKDTQSMYVLKDSVRNLSTSDLRGSNMSEWTLKKVLATKTYTETGTAANLATQNGWFVDFDQNVGERVNLDLMIAQGNISVITNIPDNTVSCKVGGSAVLYTFDVCSGAAGADGVVGVTVPGDAAAAGASIVSTETGLVAEVKLVNGKDAQIPLNKSSPPVSRRSGWRRIRN